MSLSAPWTTRSRIVGIDRTRTLPPVLRYLLLPYPHGPIRVCDQFVLNLQKETLDSAFLDDFERHSVNSRSAVVFLRQEVGFVKCLHLANMNVQSPETPGAFSLRLDV